MYGHGWLNLCIYILCNDMYIYIYKYYIILYYICVWKKHTISWYGTTSSSFIAAPIRWSQRHHRPLRLRLRLRNHHRSRFQTPCLQLHRWSWPGKTRHSWRRDWNGCTQWVFAYTYLYFILFKTYSFLGVLRYACMIIIHIINIHHIHHYIWICVCTHMHAM